MEEKGSFTQQLDIVKLWTNQTYEPGFIRQYKSACILNQHQSAQQDFKTRN